VVILLVEPCADWLLLWIVFCFSCLVYTTERAGEVSARLSLPKSTLENWVRAAKAGKLGAIGKNRKPLTEVEVELAKVKRELAVTRMERDILKKAAAYFAKESLHGTR
jgi:transposase